MNDSDLLKERQKAISEIKASRLLGDDINPIHRRELLKNSITDLLDEAKPKDEIEKQYLLHRWLNLLDTERKIQDCAFEALNNVTVSERDKYDEKLDIIHYKIKEINLHLNDCPPKKITKKTSTVSPIFSSFTDLRSNEISLVMMINETAKIVFRRKIIIVNPNDLGLKHKSQGWKLLESAAVGRGDLTNALKSLNKTNDLVAENTKIKTAINRLNRKLIQSIGLQNHPIIFDGTYKFVFKSMSHELLDGCHVTKDKDAMDYVTDDGFDDNLHGSSRFWNEDE
jgi:hypothetical protein